MTAQSIAGRSTAEATTQLATTAPLLPMLVRQTQAQLRLYWRLPAVSVTGIVMPVMLFLFFVAPHAHEQWQGAISLGAYMLPSIGAYAVGSVMMFNFGVGVALDRGQKVDILMRAAPLPGWLYLSARLVGALIFGVVALCLLFGIAITAGGIELLPGTWLGLGASLLFGSIPFVGLGFAIAYLAGPGAGPAVANLAFIGMAFASGMFVQLDQMPDLVRTVAPLLPTYHYAELARATIGAGGEGLVASSAWLVAYGIVLLAIATIAYARETRARFG